jgi:hypothetical protein
MQAAAIEARDAEHVETREPECSIRLELEADDLRPTRHDPDPLLEDTWFSRGETELAVQIVAIGRDPTDEVYLPEARSHRMSIAVGVMLASAVTALLVMS